MSKCNVIWTLHLFYRHNTSCKNIYTKLQFTHWRAGTAPGAPLPPRLVRPCYNSSFNFYAFPIQIKCISGRALLYDFRGFFGFLFVKKSFRKKCALSVFDKGRLWTVLLVEIFPIFDFSTSNSINFYTSVTQLSGKFHFKPSEVLQWSKISPDPTCCVCSPPYSPKQFSICENYECLFVDFAPRKYETFQRSCIRDIFKSASHI